MIRQAKAFLIMMDNYNRVLEATDLAYNSAGSSAQEFARWQQSLEGRLNNLKSALEQFSSETINSNFVKSILDATTAIVNMGTAMGGAIPTVLALSGAFATFKLITFAGGIGQIATAIGVLGLSISALLPAIGVAVGVGVAIAGVATAINETKNASKNAKAEVEALSTELRDLQNQSSSVKSLGEKYIELKGIDDKTNEQWREYYNVQNQLRDLIPELNGYYDEQGNFIIKNVEYVSDLTDTYKDYIAEKRKERAEASRETSKYTLKQYDDEKKKLEELTEYYKLRNEYLSGNLDEKNKGRYGQLSFKFGGISDLEEEIKTLTTTIQGLSNDLSSEIMNVVKDTDEWSKLTEDEMNAINKAFSEVSKESLPLLNEAIISGELKVEDFIKTLLKSPTAIEYLQEALEKAKPDVEELGDAIVELTDILEDFSKNQNVVNSIRESVNETGKLSLDNIQNLIDTYPQLEDVLYNYLAGLATTSDVMDEVNKAYKVDEDNYKNAIITKQKYNEEFYNNTANIGGKLVKAFNDSYGIDLSNCKNLAEAKIKVEQETIKSIATLWNRYYDTQKQDFNSAFYNKMPQEYDTKASKELYNTLTNYKNLVDARIDNLDSIVYEGITIPLINSSSGSSLSSKAKEDIKTYTETVIEEFNKANKEIERNITQLDLQQQLVGDNSQEYIDIEKKKYDEIIKLETLLQEKISLLQAKNTEESIQQAEEYIDVYYDTVQQRYSIIANLKSSQISLFEKQIESLEKQKSAMEDLHDFTMQMIEDELNAKKKSIQNEIDGIEAVFNAKKQALRDEQDTRNYDKGLSEKTSLVADLENQLAIIKNDETAIAKRKQLEEELFKAKQDLEEYQIDHSIELAEKALDTELEIQKSKLEEEIDELDATLSNEVTMRELANKRIEKSGEKLKNQLIKHAKEYGTFTIEEVTNAWDIAGEAVDDFDAKQQNLLETLKQVVAELKKVESMNVSEYGNSNGMSTATASETKAKMMANSAKWLQSDGTTRDKLAQDNQKLGKSMGWIYDPVSGRWFYDKDKKLPVYHEGGIVGGSQYATKSTKELSALLKMGEIVLNSSQTDKVMDMITNNSNSNVTISMPIVIEGNADSDTVKAFEKQINKLADTVISKLETARNNTGFKKKPKFI